MVKILIPRSNSISAKTIVPTDFEKYFDDVVNDYIISGFTVTATTGTNRSVDVSTGTGRVKGYFINNDALETTAFTFGTDNTHYLYIQLTRDGNNEPESWSYTSNTTGTPPTDSIVIAKVITTAGDISSVNQTLEFKKMSHMHTFVGTGAEIAALTTYAGMFVVCTVSGSGYVADFAYFRNIDNTAFIRLPNGSYTNFGSGADGALVISSATTLSDSENIKSYTDLTINAGQTLTCGTNGNTKSWIIFATGSIIINGTIDCSGKGGAGGGAGSGGAGGAGGDG